MGIRSWKKEFYPVPANQVPESEALDHSIRKWKGLRKANLEKHGMYKDNYSNTIYSNDKRVQGYISISVDTCALCQLHIIKEKTCRNCPLYQVRHGYQCDDFAPGENDSPFGCFVEDNDPEPMIEWLEKAKKEQEDEEVDGWYGGITNSY